MAKTKGPNLGKFEGRTIEAVEVILRKTGDGLSTPMKADPKLLSIGDEGYIVYKYRMVDVHHPAVNRAQPDQGGLKRIQVLDATAATFIDDDMVEQAIADQEIRNERWLEEQAGVSRLPDTDLDGDHLAGKHDDDPHPDCSRCEEARLEAEGR